MPRVTFSLRYRHSLPSRRKGDFDRIPSFSQGFIVTATLRRAHKQIPLLIIVLSGNRRSFIFSAHVAPIRRVGKVAEAIEVAGFEGELAEYFARYAGITSVFKFICAISADLLK